MVGPFNTSSPRSTTGITLVNGRTFTIARPDGSISATADGTVFEDVRIVARFGFDVTIDGHPIPREHLGTALPTPLQAVSVSRPDPDFVATRAEPAEIYVHRQWIGRGARHTIEIRNWSGATMQRTLVVEIGTDFAHIFDVKAGKPTAPLADMRTRADGERYLQSDATGRMQVRIQTAPLPDGEGEGTLWWDLTCPPRSSCGVELVVEPVLDGEPAGIRFPLGHEPAVPLVMPHQPHPLTIDTGDLRWSITAERALHDLASLRIFDPGDPERVIVAAGAPWFMTLFGRDSLITSSMALPFEPDLVRGVLAELASLQGRRHDEATEEEPGRILHELRRRGGSGPFARRQRYYGTVDATPLFVMVVADAHRWGAIDDGDLADLWPHVVTAVEWIRGARRQQSHGFVSYERHSEHGLDNQGWKDSWDGITYANGALPRGPIALVEVQGYAHAALTGAAALARSREDPGVDAELLEREADDLRSRFNDAYWHEPTSSYVLALTASGDQIDAITTNPGHAIWAGITDPDRADRYLDRCAEDGSLWNGWGLRTLSPSAAAYNPISYHNGSVWPHDTALVIAGAARAGRYDLVDHFVDGALDAAMHFGGRPPELFAGIERSVVPGPVAYPSSCSPQAWASASILSMLASTIGLCPPADPGASPYAARGDGGPVRSVSPVRAGGSTWTVAVGR